MEEIENLELQMLLNNKEEGFNYKERREDDWRENYELYRDKVTINRLTQRQSVNLPLMKTTLRTVLKDVDDMPVINFQNKNNDKQKEVLLNSAWEKVLEDNNAEIQDIVDKKQDFFYGRTFDSWQIVDGKIIFDIEDPEDILVYRYLNPYDLDSSRYLIHTHIFVPLSHLMLNEDYDQKEVDRLVEFFKTEQGIIKANDNQNSLERKNEKMGNLGVSDVSDPVLGETVVELTMHFVKRPKGEEWVKDGKTMKSTEEEIFVYVEAENQAILMKKPQEEIIGVTHDHYWRTHYRYNSWGDDIDNQDFWTDGIADIVRVPNKVLNTYFSQLVENRTMRNFGMHYFNAQMKADGFVPSTFVPKPWGWYPVPGNPNEVLQKVDIPDLSESIDEMEFITTATEKATGATATQQGIQTSGDTTLGEVQMVQAEAKARTQGMSKFYTDCWKKRAEKFLKLLEAGADKIDPIELNKEGLDGKDIYSREVTVSELMDDKGYRIKIWSQDERKANDADTLNKLNQARIQMPYNTKLAEITNRKALEMADLKPEEITEILQVEEQIAEQIKNGQMLLPNATMNQTQ